MGFHYKEVAEGRGVRREAGADDRRDKHDPEIRCQHAQSVRHQERGEIKSRKHLPDIDECLGHRIRPENDKADRHREQRIDVTQHRRHFLDLRYVGLEQQKRAVEQSPDNERPVRPVPQAGQEENNDTVERRAALTLAVAAQRNVDIITEPGRERDVPASPEILHI